MNGIAGRSATEMWNERIQGGPAAAGNARELLTGLLAGTTAPDRLHDLLLLATELITNAVRHAEVGESDTLELTVSAGPKLVRVGVIDPGGSTRPEVQDLNVDLPGGMGLFLVETLSRRWGVERAGSGATEVWFEVARY